MKKKADDRPTTNDEGALGLLTVVSGCSPVVHNSMRSYEESERRTKRGCSFVIVLLLAVIGISFSETGLSYITAGLLALLLFAIAVLIAIFVAQPRK